MPKKTDLLSYIFSKGLDRLLDVEEEFIFRTTFIYYLGDRKQLFDTLKNIQVKSTRRTLHGY
jgi:hypothetical protein